MGFMTGMRTRQWKISHDLSSARIQKLVKLGGFGVMGGLRFSQHDVLDYDPIGINLFESS